MTLKEQIDVLDNCIRALSGRLAEAEKRLRVLESSDEEKQAIIRALRDAGPRHAERPE